MKLKLWSSSNFMYNNNYYGTSMPPDSYIQCHYHSGMFSFLPGMATVCLKRPDLRRENCE